MTTTEYNNADSNQNNASKEHIISFLIMYVTSMWENLKINVNIFFHRIGAYEIFEKVAQLSAKHPYLALVFSIIIASILFPFLIILAFAVSTVVLTFTGFILIEGTLITIVSVLLFGCLAGVLLIFLFFGGLILASYLGFMHVFDLYNGLNKNAMKNFLNQEKREKKTSSG